MEKSEIVKMYKLTEEDTPSPAYQSKLHEFIKKKAYAVNIIGQEHEGILEDLINSSRDLDNELCQTAYYNGFSKAVRLIIEAL